MASDAGGRPQAGLLYKPGDTFVLYTDGLIERRSEDDAGLGRLVDVLGECTRLRPGQLADTVLAHLGVSSGSQDDIAPVIRRL
ncbi:SpoIIE family protein phosphatase [Streptomyces sp. Ru71]|uniref:SpoIIE family protein phosphatase n=1 Tax=Streptomyces sp. Ru71 TaxID=2080746 RepID=UPI00268F2669